jgi:hypothetical protein
VKASTFDAFDYLVVAFLNIGYFLRSPPRSRGHRLTRIDATKTMLITDMVTNAVTITRQPLPTPTVVRL